MQYPAERSLGRCQTSLSIFVENVVEECLQGRVALCTAGYSDRSSGAPIKNARNDCSDICDRPRRAQRAKAISLEEKRGSFGIQKNRPEAKFRIAIH